MINLRPSVLVTVFMLICCVVSGNILTKTPKNVEAKFVDYIVQFNKTYRFNVDEYQKRFETFRVSCCYFTKRYNMKIFYPLEITGNDQFNEQTSNT